VGELDLKQPRFIPERQGILDPGKSYASNISVDPAGRTLLWLWGKTDTPREKGWNSVMAIPRVLTLSDIDDLRQSPIAEIAGLRETVHETPDVSLTDGSRTIASGDCLDFECVIEAAAPATAGIRLRGAEILFHPKTGMLRVGSVTGFAGAGKQVKLRVLLDKRVVEVYANDGAAAVFQTVDASNGPLDLEIFAQGQAAFRALRVWKMKSARMDLGVFS
jgi:sucrose-6-phosphate hydrolase SacC (GH32 family)